MSRINLAGPFLWLWGLWHVCWLAGFVVLVPLLGVETAAAWFTLLYVWFLPQEIVGAYLNSRSSDGRARTMSEFRQFVADRGRPDRPGWLDDVLSWRGLAGATGILDAVVMGLIVGSHAVRWLPVIVGPEFGQVAGVVVGALWGLALALWLVPHYGWREFAG